VRGRSDVKKCIYYFRSHLPVEKLEKAMAGDTLVFIDPDATILFAATP
jgi:hypothetical protein